MKTLITLIKTNILLSLILIGFFQSAFSAEAKIKRINIVFDINGVTMDGYSPTPGFGDLLALLLQDPRVQIYFFSTQDKYGILSQIRTVRLPDGRTADQVAKVLDGSQMDDFDKKAEPTTSPEQRYGRDDLHRDSSSRYRYLLGGAYKDLRALAAPEDLENTILVDDTFRKAHPNQVQNLLYLQERIALYPIHNGSEQPLPDPQVSTVQESPTPAIAATQTQEAVPARKGFFAAVARFLAPPPEPQARLQNQPSQKNERPSYRDYDFRGFGRTENLRSDFMAGLLIGAIRLADQKGVSVSAALSKIQWGEIPVPGQKPERFRFGDEAEVLKYVQSGKELKRSQLSPSGQSCQGKFR